MNDQSKDVWFLQAVLTADEFASACERLRKNPSFRFSRRKIAPYQIDAVPINRMIFPLDRSPAHPAFPGAPTTSVAVLQVEWDALGMNSSEAFRDTAQHFATNSFCGHERTISCEITIGDFDVQLQFLWNAESAHCGQFEINWFMSGNRVMDWASRLQYSGTFGTLGNIEISRSFRRSRETQVREVLPFLNATRVDPAKGFNYKSTSSRGQLIWEAFLNWMENAGTALPFSTRITLDTPRSDDNGAWHFDDVWKLIKDTGGIECRIQCRLNENFIVRRNRKFAFSYHHWVAGLVGLRTVSGRAAIFDLGVLHYDLPKTEDNTDEIEDDFPEAEDDFPEAEDDPPKLKTEAYVTAFLLPDGVMLGYCHPDAASQPPPKEILSLSSGAEWIRGCPPAGHSENLPISNWAHGEEMDPVLGVTTEEQLKLLTDAVQRWREPSRCPESPGSLEEQLNQLEKVGLVPTSICDVEDFLEIHPRSWYEEIPYVNTLRCVGTWDSRFHCEKLWLLDIHDWKSQVDHCSFFKRLKSLHPGAIDISRIKTVAGRESQPVRLRFEVGCHLHEWEIEDRSPDSTAVELLEVFDQLLETLGSAARIRSCSLGEGKYVLGMFTPEQAREIDVIMPKLFEPFKMTSAADRTPSN